MNKSYNDIDLDNIQNKLLVMSCTAHYVDNYNNINDSSPMNLNLSNDINYLDEATPDDIIINDNNNIDDNDDIIGISQDKLNSELYNIIEKNNKLTNINNNVEDKVNINNNPELKENNNKCHNNSKNNFISLIIVIIIIYFLYLYLK